MITTLIILSIVLGLKQLGVNLPFVDKTINIIKTKIDKNNKSPWDFSFHGDFCIIVYSYLVKIISAPLRAGASGASSGYPAAITAPTI